MCDFLSELNLLFFANFYRFHNNYLFIYLNSRKALSLDGHDTPKSKKKKERFLYNKIHNILNNLSSSDEF
jgi:hypothetical protein